MPKWFRCHVCESKDQEIGRVYAELHAAQEQIKELTGQLLAKVDPVTHRTLNPPSPVRRQPVQRSIPPHISSLLTGGHLSTSLDEMRHDRSIRFGPDPSEPA